MASLATLPQELLSSVVSLCGPRDLLALCRILPTFSAARTRLYQHYHGNSGNIIAFTKTVLSAPVLAAKVHKVSLASLYLAQRVELSLDTRRVFTSHIHRCNIPLHLKTHWIRRVCMGHGESIAVLLLMHLPHVEHLTIWTQDSYPNVERETFWTLLALERMSVETPYFLGSLKRLCLFAHPCYVDDLAYIFNLPNMQCLQAWEVVERVRNQSLAPTLFRPKSSNISTLAFTSATISSGTLSRVLQSCKALREFTYDCPIDFEVTRDFESLLYSLSQFRGSLISLTFLEQNAWAHQIIPVQSLAHFPNLERLNGDAAVVLDFYKGRCCFGADRISGLKTIVLEDVPPFVLNVFGDSQGVLSHLSWSKAHFFPLLESVNLRLCFIPDAPDLNSKSEVLAENGLTLNVQGKLTDTIEEDVF